MKTSIFFIAALLVNPTMIFAGDLAILVQEVNPWLLVAFEIALLNVYFLYSVLKEWSRTYELEIGPLDIFVVRTPKDN